MLSTGRRQDKREKQASAADSFGASVLLETIANSAMMWMPILPASMQTCLASAHTLLPLSALMVSQAWSTVNWPRTLFLSFIGLSTISVESCASFLFALSLSCKQHAQLLSALPPDSIEW